MRDDPTDKVVTRSFKLRFDTIDDADRSVEAVIATEDPVAVFDWKRYGLVDEVLRMDGLILPESKQVPLLDTHDRSSVSSVVGSTRDLRIENGKLVGRNVLSSGPESLHAWNLIKERHLTDNSVGYEVQDSVSIERGKSANINGRNYTAGMERELRVTTKWRLKENSLCPIGADSKAKNRAVSEKAPDNIYRKEYEMNFQEWLKKQGLEYDKMADDQRAVLKVVFENEAGRIEVAPPETKTEMDPESAEGIRAQARQDERERIDSIKREGRALPGITQEMIEAAIRSGADLQKFRNDCLAEIRKSNKNSAAHATVSRNTSIVRMETVEDGLLMRAGFEAVVLKQPEGERRAEMADKIRSISLMDVCRLAIQSAGLEVPVIREEAIRVGFATAGLTTILSNVAQKSLLRGFDVAEQSWRKWCNIGSASNYKTITRVRLTDVENLTEVPIDGEIKVGSACEEAETYNLTRFGKRFACDERTLIDDDLESLTKLPKAMGDRASTIISDKVYYHLMNNAAMISDTVALFHATHANLNTTCALTATNLGVAMAAFMKQTNKDGQPINIRPAWLIVPPDLWETARVLLESDTVAIIGVGASAAKTGNINAYKGLMQIAIDARLASASYPNYATTTWYLAANPDVADTVEVSFLDGKQVPTLETFPAGPERFGFSWRVRHDFGVKALDWRGLAKCTA